MRRTALHYTRKREQGTSVVQFLVCSLRVMNDRLKLFFFFLSYQTCALFISLWNRYKKLLVERERSASIEIIERRCQRGYDTLIHISPGPGAATINPSLFKEAS